MKIVYVGGGSFRVVAVVRELLRLREVAAGCEVALWDPDRPRVEAMANLLGQAPEMDGLGATVTCPTDLDAALAGADFVEVTACPWRWDTFGASCRVCEDHGWIGSDNLSPNGAYLALRGGPMVLDVARRLERLAPAAVMLLFSNPIAILTSVVLAGTAIRAVGICGGEANHGYDLSRMMGWRPYRFDFEVEVAGVNHLSWIKALRLDGRDFYPALAERLRAPLDYGWLETDPDAGWLRGHIEEMFERMTAVYRLTGAMLFSSEGDGLPHVFCYPETVERARAARPRADPAAEAVRARAGRRDAVAAFCRLVSGRLAPTFWTDPAGPRWRGPEIPRPAPSVRIIRGLRTGRAETVTASYRNQGAIRGFADEAVVEYTMRVSRGGLAPTAGYPHALPPGAVGVTQGLAAHQALVARAILSEDRRTFEQALWEYPMCRDRRAVASFMKAMAEANRGELPAWMA